MGLLLLAGVTAELVQVQVVARAGRYIRCNRELRSDIWGRAFDRGRAPVDDQPAGPSHGTDGASIFTVLSPPSKTGARKWVPYYKPRREYGAGLLPAGYAEMEQVGKLLKARYFGPTAEVPLANVTTWVLVFS